MAELGGACGIRRPPRLAERARARRSRTCSTATLAPGDRLPGERALSAELGVGRSSVREALRVLEVLGLIRTAVGLGSELGRHHHRHARRRHERAHAPAGRGARLPRRRHRAHAAHPRDLGRGRPRRRDTAAPTSSGAERLLDAMDSPDLAPSEFLALDAAFHLALAEASGNQVITATMAGLRSGIEGYALAGVATIADWQRDLRPPARASTAASSRRSGQRMPRPPAPASTTTSRATTPRRSSTRRHRRSPTSELKAEHRTMVQRQFPNPQRAHRAHAVQEADAQRHRPPAREGAHDRRPARDREAPHAEGAVRLHRGRRRGRALARSRPPGVPGHRVPPVDPAQRARGRHEPRGARRPERPAVRHRPDRLHAHDADRGRGAPARAPRAPRASRSRSRRSARPRSRT